MTDSASLFSVPCSNDKAVLTIEQAAGVLGISTTTADNDWAYARCWLRLAIDGNEA